jgi:hypothetical protein
VVFLNLPCCDVRDTVAHVLELVSIDHSRCCISPSVFEIGNDKRRDSVINIVWTVKNANIIKLRQAFTREMTQDSRPKLSGTLQSRKPLY